MDATSRTVRIDVLGIPLDSFLVSLGCPWKAYLVVVLTFVKCLPEGHEPRE